MKPPRVARFRNDAERRKINLNLRALALCLAASGTVLSPATDADLFADETVSGAAYSQPLAHPDASALQRFAEGKSEFEARWVAPFLSGGHWGRGPQSNAESCVECHPGNGRGRAPDNPQDEPQSLVLRLARPGTDSAGQPRPHPAYGTLLNRYGILGELVEEGNFRIVYEYRHVTLADGTTMELRNPVVRIAALWFGPIGEDTILSPRLAQPVYGLGLLEAVSDSTIVALAEQQRRIGFSGRPNLVPDMISGEQMVGRFGHKASQPRLRQQVAAAFHDEIGVTSSLFPQEQCWPIQEQCYKVERISGVEATDEQLDLITDYLRLLAPPPQRDISNPAIRRGATLFEMAQCAVCHIPQINTGAGAAYAPLRNRTIHAYTDLLLHDMGPGLADGRREFGAGGSDWRTPPLWGIGLHKTVNRKAGLLHDGRARNIAEAILWHGGEADRARQIFIDMSEQQRTDLIRFVESI